MSESDGATRAMPMPMSSVTFAMPVSVLEYRRKALSESGAVVKGLVMSGHIITAAGVIMVSALMNFIH